MTDALLYQLSSDSKTADGRRDTSMRLRLGGYNGLFHYNDTLMKHTLVPDTQLLHTNKVAIYVNWSVYEINATITLQVSTAN